MQEEKTTEVVIEKSVDDSENLKARNQELQSVVDKLAEENKKRRQKEAESQERLKQLEEVEKRAKQYEEKLKSIEDNDLKAKEEYKTLFEKSSAELEALRVEKATIESSLKESQTFIQTIKQKEAEELDNLRKEAKEISEKLKDDSINSIAEALDLNKLKTYLNQLTKQQETKHPTFNGKPKNIDSVELMTIKSADYTKLAELKETNPDLYNRHITSIKESSLIKPLN